MLSCQLILTNKRILLSPLSPPSSSFSLERKTLSASFLHLIDGGVRGVVQGVRPATTAAAQEVEAREKMVSSA